MLNVYRNVSINGIQFRYWLLWLLGLIERFLMGRIVDDHRYVLFVYTATNGRYISIVAVRWSWAWKGFLVQELSKFKNREANKVNIKPVGLPIVWIPGLHAGLHATRAG